MAGLLFAEVRIKDLDGTNVEITFTYKDDKASEMGVIGSLDNWTVPGEAMEKNADGLWEKTIKALATDEIQYKFYSKGSWIFDEKSPDKKDDGYGAFNGLIVVADILSGVTPAVPGAAPVTVAGVAVVNTYPSKLSFGMTAVVGSKTTFATQGMVDKTVKGLETDTTGLYGRMTWNFNGTLMPGMTVFFNGTAFDKYVPLWQQDSTGLVSPTLDQSVAALVSGLLANPINYLGGANPSLTSLKTGIETPLLKIETGTGQAAPTKHNPVLWDTLTSTNANDGYLRFDLGSDLRKWGPLTLDANLTPNRIQGNLAAFGWITANVESSTVDFTYAAKSATSTDVAAFFDKVYAQDFAAGVKSSLFGIDLWAQGLVNVFSESPFDPLTQSAGEVKLGWNGPKDILDVSAAYRYTGTMATMIFGNNNDGTGTQGTQRVAVTLFSKPLDNLKLGVDGNGVLTTAKLAQNAVEFYAKPYLELQLAPYLGKTATLNAYAKMNYNLTDGATYVEKGSAGPFILGEGGAKFWFADPIPGVFTGVDTFLGVNNWDKTKVFTSLVTSWKLPGNGEIDVGTGLRTVRDTAAASVSTANNAVGFALGGSLKLPFPELKSPLLYGAFTWNMDPFGEGYYSLSDYITSGGAAQSDGKSQLRAFLKWEF